MHGTRTGYAALLLGILIFSSIEVAAKFIQADIPPLRLAVIRFLVGGLVMLPAALLRLRRREVRLRVADWCRLTGLGFAGVTLTIGLYHLGIARCPANVAAVVFSCNPVFVAVLAPWLVGERWTLRKVGAVICGLAGAGVIAAGLVGAEGVSAGGVGLMLLAAAGFAFYTLLLKKNVPRYGALPVTALCALTGSLLLLPISLLMEGVHSNAWSAADGWAVLYLSVVATGFGYLIYFYGIHHVEASAGSMTFFLKPFIASLFAWLVLGETVTPSLLVGGLIIVGGLTLSRPRYIPPSVSNAVE